MKNMDRLTAQYLAKLDDTSRSNWYDKNFDENGLYVPYLPANAEVWAIREKTINPIVYAVNELRRKFNGFIGLGSKNVVDCRSFFFEANKPNSQHLIYVELEDRETPVRAFIEETWGSDKIVTPLESIHYNREAGFISIRVGNKTKGKLLVEFWSEDNG